MLRSSSLFIETSPVSRGIWEAQMIALHTTNTANSTL